MIRQTDTDSVRLRDKHLKAVECNQNWIKIWNLIYDDRWFQQKLSMLVARLIKKNNLPSHWSDDIRQEAVLIFAQALRRNPDLKFDEKKGEYGSLVATILNRCCQKGLRQFRRTLNYQPIETVRETVDPFGLSEQVIELRDQIQQLPQPEKAIVLAYCHGETVDEIATRLAKSTRTIYRYLERAKAIMKDETA